MKIQITSALLLAFLVSSTGNAFAQTRFTTESSRTTGKPLSVDVSHDDLLNGRIPESNLEYQAGRGELLTNGQQPSTDQKQRVFAINGTNDWLLTFSGLRIQVLREVRVFSWNGDSRAQHDFDLHVSTDRGLTFATVAKNVRNDVSGSFNVSVLCAANKTLAKNVTDIRLTFRNAGEFRNPDSAMQSSLLEIDAMGELKPPATIQSVLASMDAPIGFSEHVTPLFNQYCTDCHSGDDPEGNMKITALNPNMIQGPDTQKWHAMLDALNRAEMPPPDMPQPTDEERLLLVHWLTTELDKAAEAGRGIVAAVPRRLNRRQYQNTLRDLLGVDLPFGQDLPDDALSTNGFTNDGHALNMSSLHFEYYVRIAKEALGKAIYDTAPPEIHHFRVELGEGINPEVNPDRQRVSLGFQGNLMKPEDYRYSEPNLSKTFEHTLYKRRTNYIFNEGYAGNSTVKQDREFNAIFHSVFVDFRGSKGYYDILQDAVKLKPVVTGGNTRRGTMKVVIREYPEEGRFVVRVKAAAVSEDGPPPQLVAYMGVRRDDGQGLSVIGEPQVVNSTEPRIYEFSERFENMVRPVYEKNNRHYLANLMHIGVWNEPSERQSTSELKVHSIDFEGPYFERWPPESHGQIFGKLNDVGTTSEAARAILQRFLRRAWRRPATKHELDRMHGFWRELYADCKDFQQSVRDTLAIALASPQFLYIHEPHSKTKHPQPNQPRKSATDLSEYELATRLSYFLWNTMPDEQLFALAAAGDLRKNLPETIQRMLDDPKCSDFIQSFADQWLDVSRMDRVVVDRRLGDYKADVKAAMKQETHLFLGELLRTNGSILQLVDSDFAMLNETLARYYKIDNVTGTEFRPVRLPKDSNRGGVLTHASILTGHSNGKDSHPVKRGVWLTKRILGTPPPPPPPGVPPLDEEDPKLRRLPIREQLAIHRNHAACNNCHLRIDPWGIAFEQFDAIGRFRSKPADAATARLPDGTVVKGIKDLKSYILSERKDDVVNSFVKHLASYALGRSLSFADRKPIEQITNQLPKTNYGMRDAILALVQSDLFLKRQPTTTNTSGPAKPTSPETTKGTVDE